MNPAERSVDLLDLMLQIERGLVSDRLIDDGLHLLPVVRMDVGPEPRPARSIHVTQEVLAFEVAHHAPIGAHPVADVRGRVHERAVPFFALTYAFHGFAAHARYLQ